MSTSDKLFSLEEADRISKDLYENGGNMTLADALKQLADTIRENQRLREALEWDALPNSGGGCEMAVKALSNKESDNADN